MWGTVHEGRVLPVNRATAPRASAAAAVNDGITGTSIEATSAAALELSQAIAARIVELLSHKHDR